MTRITAPAPAVGQVWASTDPREAGRTIRITAIDELAPRPVAIARIITNTDHVQRNLDADDLHRTDPHVTDRRGKLTRIRLDRLRPSSNGWQLIQEATPMTTPTTQELRDLIAEATAGPWRAEHLHGDQDYYLEIYGIKRRGSLVTLPCVAGEIESPADARLIALAPTLAAEVIRLREGLEALRKTVAGIRDASDALGSDDDTDPAEAMNNVHVFLSTLLDGEDLASLLDGDQ